MKVYLLGLPGSGKSTLGQPFAKGLELPFYDLDKLIEEQEGMPVPDIFSKQGEKQFRKVEAALLRSFSESHSHFVLSTGGGTPCFHEGMDYMQEHGVTLYLDVSFEELANRMGREEIKQRPLMQGLAHQKRLAADLKDRFAHRLRTYRKASLLLKGDDLQTGDLLRAFAERQ